MSDNNCIIAFYDEASTFFDCLGRYSSNSGSGSKYESSVYASIFSAPKDYNRVTLRHKTNLTNPRLNLCVLAHPSPICTKLKDVKYHYNDGLLARILLAAPEPIFNDSKTINNAPEPEISLTSILYMISKMHMVDIEFTFEQNASAAADEVFTKFSRLAQRANKVDSFLA